MLVRQTSQQYSSMFTWLCCVYSSQKLIIPLFKHFLSTSSSMANTRFDYVRDFETNDRILPNTWIVVRIDGKAFHKFTQKHEFAKPNDETGMFSLCFFVFKYNIYLFSSIPIIGLNLMNYAAMNVMKEFNEIVIAFGQSDEYSLVFHKTASIYNRRGSKILTCVNSLFTSSYVFYWSEFFGNKKLLYPPSFDARIVLYPSDQNLRDYLSWRQADTHINNMYNTVFWKLVLDGGRTNSEAQEQLSGTLSSDKNEILFSQFNVNYNNLPQMYRKGTILLRKNVLINGKRLNMTVPLFTDLIRDKFWEDNPEILNKNKPGDYELSPEQLDHPLIIKELDTINKRKNKSRV